MSFHVLHSLVPVATFQPSFRRLLTGYFLSPGFGPSRWRRSIIVKHQYNIHQSLWRYGSTECLSSTVVPVLRLTKVAIEGTKVVEVSSFFDNALESLSILKNVGIWASSVSPMTLLRSKSSITCQTMLCIVYRTPFFALSTVLRRKSSSTFWTIHAIACATNSL